MLEYCEIIIGLLILQTYIYISVFVAAFSQGCYMKRKQSHVRKWSPNVQGKHCCGFAYVGEEKRTLQITNCRDGLFGLENKQAQNAICEQL